MILFRTRTKPDEMPALRLFLWLSGTAVYTKTKSTAGSVGTALAPNSIRPLNVGDRRTSSCKSMRLGPKVNDWCIVHANFPPTQDTATWFDYGMMRPGTTPL